jgi:4-deoxy-L-threo-5-hexosulose-uronate ketol-isomerase
MNEETQKEKVMLDIRHAVHPEHAAGFHTDQLREHFLIESLFEQDTPRLVYSYNDRLIVGGIRPTKAYSLEVDEKVIGAPFLLQRREMGVINIGGPGKVTVDGTTYDMKTRDGLFIGQGSQEIVFDTAGDDDPKFYMVSAPAHASFPTTQLGFDDAQPVHLGEMENSNKRTIRKYIHPDGIESSQIVMGMTTLEKGCVWNTMPVHTHERRMEAYLYFDMSEDDVVFHFMGEPDETRHLVVRNEQAVLSPSWSIHAGSGTGAYTFIWAMAGENQTFTDMDSVPMSKLK